MLLGKHCILKKAISEGIASTTSLSKFDGVARNREAEACYGIYFGAVLKCKAAELNMTSERGNRASINMRRRRIKCEPVENMPWRQIELFFCNMRINHQAGANGDDTNGACFTLKTSMASSRAFENARHNMVAMACFCIQLGWSCVAKQILNVVICPWLLRNATNESRSLSAKWLAAWRVNSI